MKELVQKIALALYLFAVATAPTAAKTADTERSWISLTQAANDTGSKRYDYSLTTAQQNERMLQLINTFHGAAAEKRRVRVVYFNVSDRQPLPRYRQRIATILENVRAFYAAEMTRNGFANIALDFERDAAGDIAIHLVQGAGAKKEYNRKSADKMRAEIQAHFGEGYDLGGAATTLIFQNLADWSEESLSDLDACFFGRWYGDNGLCWVVDYPLLELQNLTDTSRSLRLNNDRKLTLAKLTTIEIGGIAHELGHALTLPHSFESHGRENHNLMSWGNYLYGDELRGGQGTFLSYANSVHLLSHPSFAGSSKERLRRPELQLRDIQFHTAEDKLTVQGILTSDIPIHAVMLRFDDLAIARNYEAVTTTVCPDKNGTFSLSFTPRRTKRYRMEILFRAVNHQVAAFNSELVSDENGSLSLAPLLRPAMLTTFPHAQTLQAVSAALPTSGSTKPVEPHAVPATITSTSLADLQWTEATTGFGPPMRNGLVENSRWNFLTSYDKIYSKGLYAHAPANYRFALKGQWKWLRAQCALQRNHRGSVTFRILGDGKELYYSGIVKDYHERHIEIDVSGVDQLELVTGDGGDNNGHDWGIWFAPRLSR